MGNLSMKKQRNMSEQNRTVQSNSVDNNIDNCSVCLDVLRVRTSTNSCGHQFCFNCIYRWSQTNTFCPLCRKEYTFLRKWRKTSGCQQFDKIEISSIRESVHRNGVVDSDDIEPEPVVIRNRELGILGGFGTMLNGSLHIRSPATGLALIHSYRQSRESPDVRYRCQKLMADRTYIVLNPFSDMQLVLPDNIVSTLSRLTLQRNRIQSN